MPNRQSAGAHRNERDGKLRLLLAAGYSLQDLGRAQQDVGRQQHLGKLVIRVAGEDATE